MEDGRTEHACETYSTRETSRRSVCYDRSQVWSKRCHEDEMVHKLSAVEAGPRLFSREQSVCCFKHPENTALRSLEHVMVLTVRGLKLHPRRNPAS